MLNNQTLNDHEGGITAIAFSSDGRLLASGDLRQGRGNVIVRELRTNTAPRVHKLSTRVSSLPFSPDSPYWRLALTRTNRVADSLMRFRMLWNRCNFLLDIGTDSKV